MRVLGELTFRTIGWLIAASGALTVLVSLFLWNEGGHAEILLLGLAILVCQFLLSVLAFDVSLRLERPRVER